MTHPRKDALGSMETIPKVLDENIRKPLCNSTGQKHCNNDFQHRKENLEYFLIAHQEGPYK